ncbi:2-oxoglutarate dehydrogenase, mitochondrial isoform X1 [Lates japonicus]|uniref:2-oxoglutarate dehydrogenase, mitochondrial isoform X1 n=1 Tax=Lates japonicus TaxID=270547 RepID=A0AAD3MN16_LATJO|nr:2-oxoglutarate dehydrogenase, mitochondrial isoform X1 [Lates japonicus]
MHRLRTTVARLDLYGCTDGPEAYHSPGVGVEEESRAFQPIRRLSASVALSRSQWHQLQLRGGDSWDIFFRDANAGAPPGAAYQSPPPFSGTSQGLASVQALVRAQPNDWRSWWRII